MAASRRDQILDAVVLAINTARPVGVPQFERARTRAVEVETIPAGSVAPVREDASRAQSGKGNGPTKRELELVVDVWAADDKAADDTIQWITLVLIGQRFGGLAHTVEELGTAWAYSGGKTPACRATVTLRVQYQTHEADQTRAG